MPMKELLAQISRAKEQPAFRPGSFVSRPFERVSGMLRPRSLGVWDQDRVTAPERSWPSVGVVGHLYDRHREGKPSWKPTGWRHSGECFPLQPQALKLEAERPSGHTARPASRPASAAAQLGGPGAASPPAGPRRAQAAGNGAQDVGAEKPPPPRRSSSSPALLQLKAYVSGPKVASQAQPEGDKPVEPARPRSRPSTAGSGGRTVTKGFAAQFAPREAAVTRRPGSARSAGSRQVVLQRPASAKGLACAAACAALQEVPTHWCSKAMVVR